MLSISEFVEQLLKKKRDITPEEMLRNCHNAGYSKEECVNAVKTQFPETTVDVMCRMIVAEYCNPPISKEELKDLLILCKYDEIDVDAAIEKYYQVPIGVVIMLDDSASMSQAIGLLKIDAKSFVGCLRANDQFGMVKFSTNAEWLYPKNSTPITVTKISGPEIINAKEAIETLHGNGWSTNIGGAIQLANEMYEKFKTTRNAFVLLSDGEHNTGPNPVDVLGNEPPIYIAGLGPHMRKEYFQPLLDKNKKKSQFYNIPNKNDMMKIFNQIAADYTNSMLVLNALNQYKSGSDGNISEFSIFQQGNSSFMNIVWSDNKCRYTSSPYPSENNINLVLIDPNNNNTDIRPIVEGYGYCTYDLRNLKPGKWKLLSQYSNSYPFSETSGVITFNTGINTEILAPIFSKKGKSVNIGISVISNKSPIKDVVVNANISKPKICVNQIMNEYAGQMPKAKTLSARLGMLQSNILQSKKIDIFEREFETQLFNKIDDQAYSYNMSIGDVAGIHNIEIVVTGIFAETGLPFTFLKTHSVIVE